MCCAVSANLKVALTDAKSLSPLSSIAGELQFAQFAFIWVAYFSLLIAFVFKASPLQSLAIEETYCQSVESLVKGKLLVPHLRLHVH